MSCNSNGGLCALGFGIRESSRNAEKVMLKRGKSTLHATQQPQTSRYKLFLHVFKRNSIKVANFNKKARG